MSELNEQGQAAGRANDLFSFGESLLQDLTRFTQKHAGYIDGMRARPDLVQLQITAENDKSDEISKKGKNYLDSLFGEGTVESVGLTAWDIDIVLDALFYINRDLTDEDRKETYSTLLKMMLEGNDARAMADATGLSVNQANNGLGEFKRRTLVRTRHKVGHSALVQAMERSLNTPLPTKGPVASYPSLRSNAGNSYASIDGLAVEVVYDDVLDMLTEEGLCQQIDPGIPKGQYALGSIEAKQVCRMCPLSKTCINYALTNHIKTGIWGGSSTGDRRAIWSSDKVTANEETVS